MLCIYDTILLGALEHLALEHWSIDDADNYKNLNLIINYMAYKGGYYNQSLISVKNAEK